MEMKTVVYEYVAQLAEATRNHAMIQLGLSPRGALAVCRMAKAHAYVQGRDYAMPENVAAIFPDVCCHRLLLNTKARMMGAQPGADRAGSSGQCGDAGHPPGAGMIGLRIGYALLLLAALGLDLFCGSVWTLALTLLLVLTPLGCIPLHLWAVKQIRLRLDAPVNLGKGETGTLRVQIENKTALPLGLIHVRLRLSNLLTGQSELRRCRLSARPRRTETAEYDLASAHCGRIAIEAACCRIYDPFGLIGIRLKQTVLAQTTVQPKGFAQTIFISPDANCPDDSENYAPDRAGYDLSEVYQLREYRPGDSLRQMHWKLSGKLDRLVIREASLPVRRSVLLFWERTQKAVPEETDAQADVVVTFCRSLLEAGVQLQSHGTMRQSSAA